MPVEFGGFKVNYTGIEANEILFEPVFTDEELLTDFRLMPNVVSKKKIQFVKSLEKIVRKYTGCGFKPIGGLGIYEREVSVDKHKFDLAICIDEFLDTVFEELLKKGVRIHDLTATQIEQILIARVRQAILLDISRIYFFASPNNPDPNYDQMEGVWTTHMPYLVNNNLVPYFNTGSGSVLNPGDGIDIIRTVYDNADIRLKGLPNNLKKIYVTGNIWEQYRDDLENSGGGDWGVQRMVNGVEELVFRSIVVKPQWRWDEIMAIDFGSPDAHLCLYTTPSNLVLATDLVNAQDDFMIWYDEAQEHLFVKGRWKMGGNYVHHNLFSVGY